MTEWRHWLTKYTNKESSIPNIATIHTTIPTYVAMNMHVHLYMHIQVKQSDQHGASACKLAMYMCR